MKRLLTSLFVLLATAGQTWAQVSFGHAERLNRGWRFLRVDAAWNIAEQPEMKEKNFDDSRWRRVDLPHDWGVELPMSPDKGSCQGYLPGGVAWYRQHFAMEDGKLKMENQAVPGQPSIYIYFEGVYNYSEVFLNGKLLGKRPSGFASFLYDMTPYLEPGDNVLAVRVDHSQEFDSRWYTGSGIYRNVWLVTAPEVHLAQWGTAYRLTQINAKRAELEVDVETTDDGSTKSAQRLSATVQLCDSEGRVVATARTAIGSQEKRTVTLTLKNPQRWTLDRP
ncbi:MAG: glycoside hydrolase family 2, partial [Bacteroidaceae bacterium]|nr:glycoside hydrolase family 2 [Bacteroidaceae bacterium]